ncbi:hypothetical protein PR048_028789 [Dryococelus australis]|uniref:Uncharacterized protein n=1 Tax=Dryococelus australis TaxID=614101 RepID=A0ABQ9GBJ9_9NEOP|nr:hypothetical protein PR048_028789 [Dryococelus australis]
MKTHNIVQALVTKVWKMFGSLYQIVMENEINQGHVNSVGCASRKHEPLLSMPKSRRAPM